MFHANKILFQSDVTAEHVRLRNTHYTTRYPSSPTLKISLNVSFCESAFQVSTSCHGPWVSPLKYLVNPFSLVITLKPTKQNNPYLLLVPSHCRPPLSHQPYPMWKSTILFLGVKRWKSKSISSHCQSFFLFLFLFKCMSNCINSYKFFCQF